ncbi:MAG TPA: LuxR family transcriptional regulator [Allosphingosinicella sp.]|nr:LuxR family transcriptional regulator [Allosphingosinicella sp.]
MTGFADVERFIEDSKRAATPRELESLLSSITGEMGFDYYALIHHVDLAPMNRALTHMEDGSLVALTNYPEGWVEAYVARNIVANDPVLLASHRSNVGFKWEDVPKFIDVTSAHRSITEDTRKAGLEQGYTVPAHVPGEANGSCNFAMRTGRRLPEENLLMAQMVGSFAFQAARAMVMKARSAPPLHVRPLTTRQLECLALVARGKSDWEIAHILGIGAESVKHHVKMAREHYDVPTRIQAAFRAVFESQLTISDVVP